jgi:hypothetical protein
LVLSWRFKKIQNFSLVLSSVVRFFDFPKNRQSGVFQKLKMKEPDGSGYFETLKQSVVFMKEPVVLSQFFSGSLTLKTFFAGFRKWEPLFIYPYNRSDNQ